MQCQIQASTNSKKIGKKLFIKIKIASQPKLHLYNLTWWWQDVFIRRDLPKSPPPPSFIRIPMGINKTKQNSNLRKWIEKLSFEIIKTGATFIIKMTWMEGSMIYIYTDLSCDEWYDMSISHHLQSLRDKYDPPYKKRTYVFHIENCQDKKN